MLLAKLDSAGRVLVTTTAPSATSSRNGGVAYNSSGALHVISGTPPQFANGFGVSATGQLYIAYGGTIGRYTGGLPFTVNGSLVAQADVTPDEDDPFVGGIRVGPLGGVYTQSDVPPVNSAPVNTELPHITGNLAAGSILTTTHGGWTGYPSPSFTYQWKRGVTNVGTNSASYTTVSADIGQNITCVVTATNSSGSVPATSNAVAIVSGAPTNTTLPTLSGSGKVGQTLTSTSGEWTGSPVPVISYQWKRGVTNIGTNSNSYVVVEADVGSTITCQVTATNTSGSDTATTNGILATPLLIPEFTNASHEYVEGSLSTSGVGQAFPADNDDGSFTYVFNDTGTTNSSDGYVTLVGSNIHATAAAVAGPPNSFATLPNTFPYTVRATSADGVGTGTVVLHCLEQVAGEDPIITTAKAVLATYGTDAHVWIAGVGVVGGYDSHNYTDTAGTVRAAVGDAVALVKDATGGMDSSQTAVGLRPILQRDVTGVYYWDFTSDLFNINGLPSDFTTINVIAGIKYNSLTHINATVFCQNNAVGTIQGQYRLGADGTSRDVWTDRNDAGTMAAPTSTAAITTDPLVLSGQRIAVSSHRLTSNITPTGVGTSVVAPGTMTRATIGGRLTADTNVPGIFMDGRIYAILAVKGAMDNAQLRSLQDYIALLSGVTL